MAEATARRSAAGVHRGCDLKALTLLLRNTRTGSQRKVQLLRLRSATGPPTDRIRVLGYMPKRSDRSQYRGAKHGRIMHTEPPVEIQKVRRRFKEDGSTAECDKCVGIAQESPDKSAP
jgi:hypothetical protein